MLDRRTEFTAHCPRLVKRRRALVETNPPRNSQPQLIEADGRRGGDNFGNRGTPSFSPRFLIKGQMKPPTTSSIARASKSSASVAWALKSSCRVTAERIVLTI